MQAVSTRRSSSSGSGSLAAPLSMPAAGQPAASRFAPPGRSRSARQHLRGVTLLEILVGVAITGVMVAFGVPAFARLLSVDSVARDANQFVDDARFTRSEALRRGISVTMCRSPDPQAAQPRCAGAQDAGGWHTGWIIYLDYNGDLQRAATEPVLRVQSALAHSVDLVTHDDSHHDHLRYLPTGWAPGPAATLRFVPAGASPQDRARLSRTVCVSPVGSVQILKGGDGICA